MIKRQKCNHCGQVHDFHRDCCTNCWSHRSLGKTLTEEQLQPIKESFQLADKVRQWQRHLENCQKIVLPSALALTIWGLVSLVLTAMVMYALPVSWKLLTLVVVALVGSAVGAYLVGGGRALRWAAFCLIMGVLPHGYDLATRAAASGSLTLMDNLKIMCCVCQIVGALKVWKLGPRP